jgi:preprotein translocase subunit SecD
MELDRTGAGRFAQITGDNVGRQLAIILDGNVASAPRINERIPHGIATITLGGSMDSEKTYNEASDLVVVLKAGSLPAPVTIEENRTVGPSLGKDSIDQGSFALLIGSLMVIFFMLLYYKSAGVVAIIALILNILFIMSILTLFQATLTLPGIAGIILTVGMAVDGNVIINERIKEELKAGRTLQAAIGMGYDRAQLTLLDANLTTLFAGIILFQYGTGPIQGFAVTLMIGVITSFITSLSVTRFIFEFYLEKLKFKSLWI